MADENRGPEMTDQQVLAVLANADDRNLRSDEVVEERDERPSRKAPDRW